MQPARENTIHGDFHLARKGALILVVGLCGDGKSSFCNLIAGTSFPVARYVRGTLNAAVDKGTLDVPGFEYEEKYDARALMELVDVLTRHTGQIIAVCYVISYGTRRMEIHGKTVRLLKNFFGDRLNTNMCVVITGFCNQQDYLLPYPDGRKSTVDHFFRENFGVGIPSFGISCYPDIDVNHHNHVELPLFFAWLRGLQLFSTVSIPKAIELANVTWSGSGTPSAQDLAKYGASTYFSDGSGAPVVRTYSISLPDSAKWKVISAKNQIFKTELWDDSRSGRYFIGHHSYSNWAFVLQPLQL